MTWKVGPVQEIHADGRSAPTQGLRGGIVVHLDEGNVAADHVDELRQRIHPGIPEEPAYPRDVPRPSSLRIRPEIQLLKPASVAVDRRSPV